jgi:hypothetical protein
MVAACLHSPRHRWLLEHQPETDQRGPQHPRLLSLLPCGILERHPPRRFPDDRHARAFSSRFPSLLAMVADLAQGYMATRADVFMAPIPGAGTRWMRTRPVLYKAGAGRCRRLNHNRFQAQFAEQNPQADSNVRQNPRDGNGLREAGAQCDRWPGKAEFHAEVVARIRFRLAKSSDLHGFLR